MTDRFDLRALYEASRLLSTSGDRNAIVRTLLLSALSKLLVTRGVVLLWEPLVQRFRVADVRGPVGMAPGEELTLPQPVADRLLLEAEVPEVLRQRSLCLVVPLMFRHRLLGLLSLGRKATGEGGHSSVSHAFGRRLAQCLADRRAAAGKP